ncbi:uncharacterized protein LOC129319024 [Prosopis cineraria]|uniref:uncharacterized protein LOC129319024 n=1 Tax=Prosopis cineraria TaxID=364024 RepID=UPI00240F4A47|nr:uncharacterized protein LOC129319024 [Prosopis cineraria]
MGDPMAKKTNLVKPRMELEELYQGIPDESVNLTFQDLAKFNNASEKKMGPPILPEPVSEQVHGSPRHLIKIPSLEFSTGLHEPSNNRHVHRSHDDAHVDAPWDPYGNLGRASGGGRSPRVRASGDAHSGYNTGYDDLSTASGRGGGRRRRPGIPHTKICTICSTYVYVFRTRCLVCGRLYCRQCLEMGMGDMIEGRKCIECLGLRFSQRYIEKAGKVWCWGWRYPSTLKQVELKWAEKGPKRTGDKGYNSHYGGITSSISRSPITQGPRPTILISLPSWPHPPILLILLPSTTIASLFSPFPI